MLKVFSEKDTLTGKGTFVLECSTLGTKPNHYFNCLEVAEWEATTPKYSHNVDSHAYDPRISGKVEILRTILPKQNPWKPWESSFYWVTRDLRHRFEVLGITAHRATDTTLVNWWRTRHLKPSWPLTNDWNLISAFSKWQLHLINLSFRFKLSLQNKDSNLFLTIF